MLGLILSLLASVLKWILQPIAYLFGCFVALCKGEFNSYNMELAKAKDRLGNVLCKYLFNLLLIKRKSYKFGNGKETISSVLGKNKRDKTLTIIGRLLDYVLDKFDKNHSINSIENNL